MMDDAELLRRYVEDRAENAFTEIVHRHLGLVYSTALRRVGRDAQLAEDVAQKVFTDLARKAPSLRGRTTLGGWLYVSANVASAAIVRAEQRRKVRETEAQTMQTLLAPDASDANWNQLRPMLDEAIVELRDDEREVVVLRFFEKRSFAEVGAALRLSEEAARKRVERAVEKLRDVLARRGFTSSTAVLSLTLADVSTAAAPAGLVTKIAGTALSQGTVPSFLNVAWQALTSGVALTGAALLIGGFCVAVQWDKNRQLSAELARLEQDSRAATALRTENHRLTQLAASTAGLRQSQAELPALRAAVAESTPSPSAATTATVGVTNEGTLVWDNKPVTLAEFLKHLKTLHDDSPAGDSLIVIRAATGAKFSQVAYVLDEVRKARLKKITIATDLTPDPGLGFSWF